MKTREQLRKATADLRKKEERARSQMQREIIAGERHPSGLLKTETERWNDLHPEDPR